MSSEPDKLPRILVVDDSKVMLKAAQKILGAEFDVITAVDGADAWRLLERDATIQVVFTDLDMPNSDGYELLQKIRAAADLGLQGLPVIVVTAAEDDETALQKSLHLGATDFITKPFSSMILMARARAHATYQRITKQLQAQSTLDPLTGLANRPGFLDRLQQDIAYARRHQQAITLMRVEIDDLSSLLRKHGKGVVEQLVVHVSKLITPRIRKEDTAARVGVGGFAISLPAGQLEGIEGMADWLHAQVAANPPNVDGELFPIAIIAVAISAELKFWSSAREALDSCEAMLERASTRRVAQS